MKQTMIIIGLCHLTGCGGAAAPPAESAEASLPKDVSSQKTETGELAGMSAPNEGMVEVSVEDVLQQEDGAIVVVLREEDVKKRIVPIFIGDTEGRAIAMRLTRQKYVRPLTHDLLETVIGECGIRLLKVEIDDLQDKIFLAHLFLIDQSGAPKRIDARPSDAIALALGVDAPIYIAVTIVEEIGESSYLDPDEPTPSESTPATPTRSETPLREI